MLEMARLFNNLETYTVKAQTAAIHAATVSSVKCQQTIIPNRLGLYGQVNKRIRWMPRR